MNLELFIAKKLSFGNARSFTRAIIKMAIAGIAISIAVMIISSFMIKGFRNEVTQKIFGFWGNIHITDIYVSNSNEPIPIKVDENIKKQMQNIAYIEYQSPRMILGKDTGSYKNDRTQGGVKAVQSYASINGIIKTKEYLEGVILKGISTDFDWDAMRSFLKKGDIINFKEGVGAKEIMISEITAKRLNLDVGKKLIVHFIRKNKQIKKAFKVVGIYSTGLEEYDKKIVLVDIKKVQEVYGWEHDMIAGYEVVTEHFEDMDVISEHIYDDIIPNNLLSQTIREKFPSIFEWLEMQKLNEWVILGLMVVVCIINMITALLILILERTKMIGVLKSLGQKNWNIRKIFLYQGGIILLYGLFWGNLIGVGLSLLQKYTGFIKLDEESYYLSEAPIEFSLPSLLIINVGTLILVVLCLVIPTFVITKIQAIRVLRFD